MFKRFIAIILMFLLLASSGTVWGQEGKYPKALFDKEKGYYGLEHREVISDECTLLERIVKISGLQFDKSGDLDLFWYTTEEGYKHVIPFREPESSQAERHNIHQMININQRYFIVYEICSNAGIPYLVEMYILDRSGKPYKRKPWTHPNKPERLQ